jgi:hypothetical protein
VDTAGTSRRSGFDESGVGRTGQQAAIGRREVGRGSATAAS